MAAAASSVPTDDGEEQKQRPGAAVTATGQLHALSLNASKPLGEDVVMIRGMTKCTWPLALSCCCCSCLHVGVRAQRTAFLGARMP